MIKRLLTSSLGFLFVLSACNLPGSIQASPPPFDNQVATVVAQTLAALSTPGDHPTPTMPVAATPTSPIETPLAISPSPAAGLAATGTPQATILTVDSNTNCREGPGTNYSIVITLVPGTIYQIVARSADDRYWVVTDGRNKPCWVLAEYSNAFGNVALLPVITPLAATLAPGGLQAPTSLRYQFFCRFVGPGTEITVTLTWTDRSTNETGFRVYRNGVAVAQVPANTTTYTDVFTGSATVTYTYRIGAFNAAGEALGNPISFSCQG